MDIKVECRVSLSKKLRSIIGDNDGGVVLVVDKLNNGNGTGHLTIHGEFLNIDSAQQILGQETNIQFTPYSISEETTYNTEPVSNLFSSGDISQRGKRTPVDKIAATTPPGRKEVAHAIKKREEIITPDEFIETEDPDYNRFVSSLEDLMIAVKAAQGKESDIDIESITDPRKRALAIEMKEQSESIDIPAYIVNDTCSSVTLNDIDLSLNLNMPVNLSNISAKRLAQSGDLKSMVRSNVLKFISPDEVGNYRSKAIKGVEQHGLGTYSRNEAENAIFVEGSKSSDNVFPDAEIMHIEDDPNDISEQEQLAGLINLSGNGSSNDDGVRTSYHGSGNGIPRRRVGGTPITNSKGIKTISKL